MAGLIRPAAADDLRETGIKKPRQSDSAEDLPASNAEEVAQPPLPFPSLLSVQAGMAPAACAKISASSITLESLLISLESDELKISDLEAAEIAAKFHATKEVEAMYKMQIALPRRCPFYIPRYFALEQRGTPHVKTLSSKISTKHISPQEIPLLRFLPLCTNLRKFELEIETVDERMGSDTVESIQEILVKSSTLEEFKLNFTEASYTIEDEPDEEGNITTGEATLGRLLKKCLKLPTIKTIEISSLIPGFNLNEIYHHFDENSLNKTKINERMPFIIIKGATTYGTTMHEAWKFLSGKEFINCLEIMHNLSTETDNLKCVDSLSKVIPQLGVYSNKKIENLHVEITYVADGKKHYYHVGSSEEPSYPTEKAEGYVFLSFNLKP